MDLPLKLHIAIDDGDGYHLNALTEFDASLALDKDVIVAAASAALQENVTKMVVSEVTKMIRQAVADRVKAAVTPRIDAVFQSVMAEIDQKSDSELFDLAFDTEHL